MRSNDSTSREIDKKDRLNVNYSYYAEEIERYIEGFVNKKYSFYHKSGSFLSMDDSEKPVLSDDGYFTRLSNCALEGGRDQDYYNDFFFIRGTFLVDFSMDLSASNKKDKVQYLFPFKIKEFQWNLVQILADSSKKSMTYIQHDFFGSGKIDAAMVPVLKALASHVKFNFFVQESTLPRIHGTIPNDTMYSPGYVMHLSLSLIENTDASRENIWSHLASDNITQREKDKEFFKNGHYYRQIKKEPVDYHNELAMSYRRAEAFLEIINYRISREQDERQSEIRKAFAQLFYKVDNLSSHEESARDAIVRAEFNKILSQVTSQDVNAILEILTNGGRGSELNINGDLNYPILLKIIADAAGFVSLDFTDLELADQRKKFLNPYSHLDKKEIRYPHLRNFEPWHDIPEFLLLTGRNNVGKTNVLNFFDDCLYDSNKKVVFIEGGKEHSFAADSEQYKIEIPSLNKEEFIAAVRNYNKQVNEADLGFLFNRRNIKLDKNLIYLESLFAELESKSIPLLPESEDSDVWWRQVQDVMDQFPITKFVAAEGDAIAKLNAIFMAFELQKNKIKSRFEQRVNQSQLIDFALESGKSSLGKADIALKIVEDDTYFSNLVGEYVKEKQGIAPWEELTSILAKYRKKFPYRVSYDAGLILEKEQKGNWIKIQPEELSGGEKEIFRILTMLYSHEGYHAHDDASRIELGKPDYIIFDEPDSRYDPQMIQVFMQIIYEEFYRKHEIKIALSTHRSQTISCFAKLAGEDVKIFTIKERSGRKIIEPTHKVLALQRLERKETFVNVYTEANTDGVYYTLIDAILRSYAEQLTEEIDWFRYSKRIRAKFMGSSSNGDDQGGAQKLIHNVQQEINNLNIERHIAEVPIEMIMPFALHDNDNGNVADKIEGKIKEEIGGRFVCIKRRALENFICDPFFLISILTEKEIQDVKKDEIREQMLKCKELYNQDPLSLEFRKEMQNLFGLFTPKNFSVHDLSQKLFIDVIYKGKGANESGLKKKELGKLKDAVKEIYQASGLMGDKNPKAVADAKRFLDSEKEVSGDNIVDIIFTRIAPHNQNGLITRECLDAAIELPKSGVSEISVIHLGGGRDFSSFKVEYPQNFLTAPSHDLEKVIGIDKGLILKRLGDSFKDGVFLPQDLLETMCELNEKMREQMRLVTKPREAFSRKNQAEENENPRAAESVLNSTRQADSSHGIT